MTCDLDYKTTHDLTAVRDEGKEFGIMSRTKAPVCRKVLRGLATPADLRSAIERLDVKASIAEQFEKDLVRLRMSDKDRRWYSTQKEHWLGWLNDYDGPGYYGRQDLTERTAQRVFNRIMNPAMILWLVDASGIARNIVESARQAALDAKRSYPSQCAAIRRVAPWDVVLLALTGSQEGIEQATNPRKTANIDKNKAESQFSERSGAAAREAILRRDSKKCQSCGAQDRTLEVHHKSPVELGGTDEAENLVTICDRCHKVVHRFGDRAKNWNVVNNRPQLTPGAMRSFESATGPDARTKILALATEIAAAKVTFPKSTAEMAAYKYTGSFRGIVNLATACNRIAGRNRHLGNSLTETAIADVVAKVWHFTPDDVRLDCSIAMAHRGQTIAINHRNHLLMRIPARRDLGRTTTLPALFLLATLDGPLARRFDLAFERYALFDACMVNIDATYLGSLTDAEWQDYATACELARSAQRTRGRRSNIDPDTIPTVPSGGSRRRRKVNPR